MARVDERYRKSHERVKKWLVRGNRGAGGCRRKEVEGHQRVLTTRWWGVAGGQKKEDTSESL